MIFKTFSSNGGFLSSFGVFGRSFSQITQSVSNDIQRWKKDAQYSQEMLDTLTESNGGKYQQRDNLQNDRKYLQTTHLTMN